MEFKQPKLASGLFKIAVTVIIGMAILTITAILVDIQNNDKFFTVSPEYFEVETLDGETMQCLKVISSTDSISISCDWASPAQAGE